MPVTKTRKGPTLKKALRPLVVGKYPETPFYEDVYCPKAWPAENIEWRLRWMPAAARDVGLQRELKQAAFDDVLFFFNAMCWCFEPRGTVKVRPFCTWPHQDPAILAMDKAITDAEVTEAPIDLVVDKSRGQGATWMFLLIFLRRWLRDPMFSAGLVTRNEGLVDSLRDPDTLMWKIVWELGMLPYWMLPEGFDITKNRNVSEHSLANPENGASIVGYAATGDVARGGRKSVFVFDEAAAFKPGDDYAALDSTQHVTNCRFLVSTHLGDSGAYYTAATQARANDNNAVLVVLDWKDNPTQNAKLYRMVNNKIFEADPQNPLRPDELELIKKQHVRLRRRGYKIADKLRNTWYNEQCLRPGATPRGIAQELDRDPKGSVSKVFNHDTLKLVEAESARPPEVEGNLVYDPETARVRPPYVAESDLGDLKLWIRPGLDGAIPPGLYVIGADVSSGTGGDFTSNSVACIINRMTGEQVGEWASNSVIPSKFAYLLAALGYWFHGAELIVESNFAGAMVKLLIGEIAYQNLYYRETDLEGYTGTHVKSKKAGFWMKDDNVKLGLFEGMQAAMAEKAFRPRSLALLKECPEYEWKNGHIIHVGSARSDDEGSKGKAHGDRVIAASLAWMLCDEGPVFTDDDEAPIKAPPGSMAEMLQIHDEQEGQSGDPWEEEDIDIFCGAGAGTGDPWD